MPCTGRNIHRLPPHTTQIDSIRATGAPSRNDTAEAPLFFLHMLVYREACTDAEAVIGGRYG